MPVEVRRRPLEAFVARRLPLLPVSARRRTAYNAHYVGRRLLFMSLEVY